jgi:MIP family channel proteins
MAGGHRKGELCAEFLGTFVVIAFGAGVVAQYVLSAGKSGSYLAINIGWGIAVTMGVYVAGGISGAHLNPAVTLALATRRRLPWSKVIPYSLAQTAGAFSASALVYLVYRDALDAFDGGTRLVTGPQGTAGIFATYPAPHLSVVGGLVDQFAGTAILLLVICALTDARNLAPGANVGPLMIGLVVVAIGAAFGFNSGYAINPARDLGPRLFTCVAGWGPEVFRAGNGWFWIPIVGPLAGGVAGAAAYEALIGRFLPPAGLALAEEEASEDLEARASK